MALPLHGDPMVLLNHTIKILLLRVGSEKRVGKGQESRNGKRSSGEGTGEEK